MTPRHRNALLILICGALIVALPMLQPEVRQSPFDWDWRAVTATPFEGLGPGDDDVTVRVLDAPDAAWTAELLWSAGLLGVRVGEPDPADEDVVWVVTADGWVEHRDAVVARAAAGGPIVSMGADGLADLGLDAPATWTQGAAVAHVTVPSNRGAARDLALPESGLEWPGDPAPPPAPLTVRRAGGGGDLVRVRDRLVAFSFDLAGHALRLRMGDSALAGIDTDGDGLVRVHDLRPFPWASPTWRTPSADAWAEVLVAAVEQAAGRPGRRVWPFPGPEPTAVVPAVRAPPPPAHEPDLAVPPDLAAALDRLTDADAEATLLLAADPSGVAEDVAALERRAAGWGHGLGVLFARVPLTSPRDADRAARAALARAEERFVPRIVANDDGAWWGWDEPARLAAERGVAAHLNHASDCGFLASDCHQRPGPGFAWGGTRPLRHLARDGTALPILSLPVPAPDLRLLESGGVHADEPTLATRNALDVAARWRVPFTALVSPRYADQLAVLARERGLSVLSADRYAAFAWERLAVLTGATRPAYAVSPLHAWLPDASCDAPVRFSPLSKTGCVVPLAEAPSTSW